MVSQVVGALIFLAVLGIVATSPDGGVDCRKFVFAPLCRGVAAKRDSNLGRYEPAVYINEESVRKILGPLQEEVNHLEDDEDNEVGTPARKQSKIENLLQTFKQEQNDRLLRILFGSRRSNSKKENSQEENFDNISVTQF